MNKRIFGLYVILGLVIGAVFGSGLGAVNGNPLSGVGIGSLAGVFIGWFVAAIVNESNNGKKEDG